MSVHLCVGTYMYDVRAYVQVCPQKVYLILVKFDMSVEVYQ